MKLAGILSMLLVVVTAGAAGEPASAADPGPPEEGVVWLHYRPLVDYLREAVAAPELEGALVGVQVTNVKTGRSIFSHRPDQLINPASVTKMFTTAGATRFTKLKSNRGKQIYEVPARIDVSLYNEVWVWCERFSVPLGVATLN